MKSSYKQWVAGGLVLIAVALLSGSRKSEAQAVVPNCPTGTELHGWAWSNNIGWISFNSGNTGSGGGPHCVSINGSVVSGWAWSSNVGWIKFGGLSGFPAGGSTAGDAHIVDNGRGRGQDSIEGWARACAGTVKLGDDVNNPKFPGDCSSMTSRLDGWDGWIELSGVNHYLAYSSTGAITGNAWGADVIGEIGFNLSSTPTTTVDTTPSCALNQTDLGSGNYRLSWETRNVSSCTGTNFTPGSISGNQQVHPNASTIYSLSCIPSSGTGANAFCSTSVTVNPVNPPCVPGSPNCPIIVCPQGQTCGPLTLMLRVADSRFGTTTNTSNTGITPVAQVQKGKPFSLTASLDTNQFEEGSYEVISSSPTGLDSTKVNESQSITQNTPEIIYTLRAEKETDSYTVSIKVRAVDTSLGEI